MNVIMLNFIIAILSDVYANLIQKSTALYLHEVILLRGRLGHTKKLSSLVSTWVPFNLIPIILSPLILIFKSETLNSIVLHIEFVPIFIFGTSIFFLSSAVLLPFAYVIGTLYKMRRLCSYTRETLPHKIGVFVIFFLFGILILLFFLVVDTIIFIKECYTSKLKRRFKDDWSTPPDEIPFKILIKTLAEYDEKHRKNCVHGHFRSHKTKILAKEVVILL